MFSGSDEFVLREIANYVMHLDDLYNVTVLNSVETHFANVIKLYELGVIDKEEFNREYSNYKRQYNDVRSYIK